MRVNVPHPIISFAPSFPHFKTGGYVKGKPGQPIPAILHSQEYVLPRGINPTQHQLKMVKRLRKK